MTCSAGLRVPQVCKTRGDMRSEQAQREAGASTTGDWRGKTAAKTKNGLGGTRPTDFLAHHSVILKVGEKREGNLLYNR